MAITKDYDAMQAQEKQETQRLLKVLREIGGRRTADDDLIIEGSKFVLPEGMTPESGIKFLMRHIEQQDEETAFSRTFKYRPWDGAHALQKGLKEAFGTTGIGKTTYSFFGKNPPEMRTIDISPTQQAQVPWGQIEFPLLEATLILNSIQDNELGALFHLTITCPRKYAGEAEAVFKVVENELKSNSIYRGQAFNGAEMPQFFDPFAVDRSKVIYSEDVYTQLEANIWSLIRYTDATRESGLPLKRAALLAGPYGTGKSLAAQITAQEALDNGWTFVMCRPGRDNLRDVMQTAMLYQPAVVFYEDVDTLASNGDPEKISELLDIFDGISVKGTELLLVLTTNHTKRIHKGMYRPGRLDSVIMIEALDPSGYENLIKAVVPSHMLEGNIDYPLVAKAMEGFLPAFVKESIDRAVRYALARSKGKPESLTTDDFVDAALGLRPQLELMSDATEGEARPTLDSAFDDRVKQTMQKTLHGAKVSDGGRLNMEIDVLEVNQDKNGEVVIR